MTLKDCYQEAADLVDNFYFSMLDSRALVCFTCGPMALVRTGFLPAAIMTQLYSLKNSLESPEVNSRSPQLTLPMVYCRVQFEVIF